MDRFDTNDIAHFSSQRNAFFLRLKKDSGYALFRGLPIVAQSHYHLTKEQYEARLAMHWPARNSKTIPMQYTAIHPGAAGAPPRPVPGTSGTVQMPVNP